MAITVRSQQHLTAVNGVGTPFSVTSKPGDVAVIIYSSQLKFNQESEVPVPADWHSTKALSIGSSARGGYIAWRRITNPSQTQDVQWWHTSTSWTSRQNGSIYVLEGAQSIALGEWGPNLPTVNGEDTFVFSQMHGASVAQPNLWTVSPGTILYGGEDQASTVASWSSLRIARTTATPTPEGGKTPPQAWGTFKAIPTGAPVEGLKIAVWMDGFEQVPQKAGIMPYGCREWSTLLSKNRFVVAHRGGSRSWKEHTQRAYTNAIAHGVDAIEFSGGLTKDGVWFGCHDLTLERLGGPATDVRQLTWEEVVAAMAGTEYMPARLDWLLATYGRDITIVFDPKYSTGSFDSYIPLLEPYKDSIMLKSYGDASWAFSRWKDAGFGVWAYLYPGDKAKDWWATTINDPNVDTLSFEWNADGALFNELLATGKPVTSHIPVTTDQVQTGWDRGCQGCMCAIPGLVLSSHV